MRNLFKDMVVLGLGALAVVYLANPTAGFFELIPDNIPLIGNLDEAAAVVILLNTLRYYGVDLINIHRRDENQPDSVPGQVTGSK